MNYSIWVKDERRFVVESSGISFLPLFSTWLPAPDRKEGRKEEQSHFSWCDEHMILHLIYAESALFLTTKMYNTIGKRHRS